MRLQLVPRERQFFTLFQDEAAILREALDILNELLQCDSKEDFASHAVRLREVEHRADEVTHRIIRELNSSFITPFDREDIYALASTLDDVVDLADETGDTIVLDGVERITPEARQMGAILVQLGDEVVQAIDNLETRKDIARHNIAIHDLENQGDTITRQAIGALFHNGHDPLYVIKWKDVYALLEKTVDSVEDIANILESVTIKNA